MAKGKVTVKSLRAGQTVYRVSGHAGSAHLSTLHITSRPYQYKKKSNALHGTFWVNYIHHYKSSFTGEETSTADSFSLRDAGIIKAWGTLNRTFYNLKAAERWKEYVNSLPKEEDDDFWSSSDWAEWETFDGTNQE